MEFINANKALKLFQQDKIKNSNVIVDLLKNLESKNRIALKKSVLALQKIFSQLIQDGDIKRPRDIPENSKIAKDVFHGWLFEQYDEFCDKLLKLLSHKSFQIKELALTSYVETIQKEGLYPLSNPHGPKVVFPINRFKKIIQELLSYTVVFKNLIRKNLPDYFLMPDFMLHSLETLSAVVKNSKTTEKSPMFLENIFSLLELLNLVEEDKQALEPPKNFLNPQGSELSEKTYAFKYSYKLSRKYFNGIWEEILKWDLPKNLHKRCLVLLPEKVMRHLTDPIQLTDFFMNAYNRGGPSSILALHGVFILINEYNMEYPDFYLKLYALFEPNIFHQEFKSRFFTLTNLFLSSTLLPEYYLAAFLKRICRLMLVAPSSTLVYLLKFSANLLVRFPSLQRLLNSADATCLEDDPYNEDEPDPSLCHAGDSSLWEISTLRHHPLPGVSKAANFIWRNLPDVELNITKYLQITADDLYYKANKITIPEVEVVYTKSSSLICVEDKEISSEWSAV